VSSSGDFVTEDIWFRIIQMITGFGKEINPAIQKYAAQKVFGALNIPHVHETLV
jgi:AP-2 complex subunit alpha